jgi:hypothetical protein
MKLPITIILIGLIVSKLRKSRSKSRKEVQEEVKAYGFASNDNYMLSEVAGFKNAELMDRIPQHLNHPYTGEIVTPTTVISYLILVCFR